jgi:hypothetical protein
MDIFARAAGGSGVPPPQPLPNINPTDGKTSQIVRLLLRFIVLP